MRIAARRGSRLHAPENSLTSLIAAYTAGADVLQISVRLTRDGIVVLVHDATTDRLTGTPGSVHGMTLDALRELDFSRTFKPRNSPGFRYFRADSRRLAVDTLPAAIEVLPEDAEILIDLRIATSEPESRRQMLVRQTMDCLVTGGIASRTVVCSADAASLRLARSISPAQRIAVAGEEMSEQSQLDVLAQVNADGIVTRLEQVVAGGQLTPFGDSLAKEYASRGMSVGVIANPSADEGAFKQSEWQLLAVHPFVWALGTDSMFDVAFARPAYLLESESFAGATLDRTRFALGYAKANSFAEVSQQDGIHIRIKPYPEIQAEPADALERRLRRIESRLVNVAREWPYYSGGGVGYIPGIRGNFSAEIEYTVEVVAQATTLEMAVLNVDPGAHRSTPPTSFRDKDSFYDPHGAPPYVGVEHDEDDGFRINWNLGTEYDNNQYGRPVGDGKTPRAAQLRLERRGPFFSAYYKNEVDAHDWVCCGVARNYSLNHVVHLRCVGKRWRQESEANPNEYVPIVPNHFVFRNLRIQRF